MKHVLITSFLLAGCLPVAAHAELALAKSSNCMACHTVEKKRVGPALNDVAKKYAGQPQALAYLSNKILHGGSGVWGVMAMPSNPQVSEADARKLAQWVLDLK